MARSTTEDATWAEDTNGTSAWRQAFQPYLSANDLIWTIGSPIIIVLGSFGNVMIVLIMHRMAESSLGVFFQVLAWSDLLLLTTGLLPVWLERVFHTTLIEDLGSFPCKVYPVLVYVTGVLSPWMLVALTMQRAASVLWPHRVNAVWTRAKSRVVAAALVGSFVLFHSHFLYGRTFDPERCGKYSIRCCPVDLSAEYRWFYYVLWPWVDLVEFSLLPFLLLVLSNAALLWKLVASVREGGQRLPVQQSTQESRQRKVSSLTVTLVTVSVSFLLLTTPMSIYFITKPLVVDSVVQLYGANPDLQGQYLLFWASGNMLWYTNSAVNFYLYCLTGTRFRAEFLNIAKLCFSLCFNRTRGTTARATAVGSSKLMSSGGALGSSVGNNTVVDTTAGDSDF